MWKLVLSCQQAVVVTLTASRTSVGLLVIKLWPCAGIAQTVQRLAMDWTVLEAVNKQKKCWNWQCCLHRRPKQSAICQYYTDLRSIFKVSPRPLFLKQLPEKELITTGNLNQTPRSFRPYTEVKFGPWKKKRDKNRLKSTVMKMFPETAGGTLLTTKGMKKVWKSWE